MNLPAPADFAGVPEDESARVLAQAVRVVELLIGSAIEERSLSQEVFLGGAMFSALLDHYPVQSWEIHGNSSPRGFYLDEGAGIVYADSSIPPASYRVDFRVGRKAGEVPAICAVLIERIAKHLLGEDENPWEILELAEAAASMTDAARTARDEHRKAV